MLNEYGAIVEAIHNNSGTYSERNAYARFAGALAVFL